MTLVGRTALSLDTSTKRSTPSSLATSASDERAERVVLQAGERVRLDDRDVLVGGGVIDHLDAELLEWCGRRACGRAPSRALGRSWSAAARRPSGSLCSRRLSSSISIAIS